MEFSRTSTKTERFRFEWISRDVFVYDSAFRAIRDKAKRKMARCFKCHRQFEDGEHFGLGCVIGSGKGNQPLCHQCCDGLLVTQDL